MGVTMGGTVGVTMTIRGIVGVAIRASGLGFSL